MSSAPISDSPVNYWANYWRCNIGVNVIPADTRNKRPKVNWKDYQNSPIPVEQFDQWIAQDEFKDGMAIILGRVWHNPAKKDLYLIGVDLDNQRAIDEFRTRNGVKKSLSELAKKMIIEQHKDEPNKAHVIFYATAPFPKKSSDVARLSERLGHNEVPAIEVKGLGGHGILFVTPSPHKNGFNYEIVGTKDPEIIDEMKDHLQEICQKYGIQYPADSIDESIKNDHLISIKDLFTAGMKVQQGNNRHEAALRVMESLLLRLQAIIPPEEIKSLAEKWNNNFCQPPLERREMERQWKDAVKFVGEINKRRAFERYQLEERQKRELVEQEWADSEERKKEKKNPLRIGVLARMNEEGKNHYAAGQLSSLGMLYKRVQSIIAKCNKCGKNRVTVFPHPQTRQYYLGYLADTGECQFYFPNSECNGKVQIEPHWVSALDIEVSDANSLQDIDRLKCVLLGEDTEDVGIGENVTIFGSIYMEQPSKNSPTFPICYIQSIKYEDREVEELTRLDIEAIKRFRSKFPNDTEFINKLVSMTACNIIGLDHIKEGILYMVARAKPDKPNTRERIHGIIISLPGMAKTALLMYATKLMERSTFETAQLSTGLSLIVVVENTGDMKVLRLGPVSTSLFACVDEFNRLSGADQEKFFGVMEEGRTTTAKFGRKVKIIAPVTILASINPPEGSSCDSEGKIDLDSMNIIGPMLSRYDLKFYIPPLTSVNEIRKVTDAKADFEGHEVPDYSKFLKKLMIFVKQQFNPILSAEAVSIVKEAYIELKKQDNRVSLRVYNLLVNLTKARARLLFKKVANSEDAMAGVKYYLRTIKDYQRGTIEPKDPIEVGIIECKRHLIERVLGDTIPYTEEELLKKACDSNPQVDKYIKSGVSKKDYFNKSNNKRARYILERLRVRYHEIKVVFKRPVTLKWIADNKPHSDHSDHSDTPERQTRSKSMPEQNTKDPNPNKETPSSEHNSSVTRSEASPESGSERSERSESIQNKANSERLTASSISPTNTDRSNPNRYKCPDCNYKNADPSKITEHQEEAHKKNLIRF